ncbi:MAG: M48 family metallopeptidase [Paludibacteraceae bacterium]
MIQDKEIGLITFNQNVRARRISIRILSDSLLVNLPRGYQEKDALKFIEGIRDKIIKRQKSVRKASILLVEGKTLTTLTFDVFIRKCDRKAIFASLKSGILSIECPYDLNIEHKQTQTCFWNAINYFLRKEAKRILPHRTSVLADEFGFSFIDVKIQSSKTRWGSCNQRKNINLSFYLMLLPQHLVDYVILHELCHTMELNHSPKFWKWMDKVTDGQAINMRSELKKYSIPK